VGGETRDRTPRVVYASSSSIYGNAMSRPTREDALPAPVSPYGVTKLAAEHLVDTYHHNFGMAGASLRFFTVFGERQRPDMAFHRFARAILRGEPLTVYSDGHQSRDFTYVGDIVAACVAAMEHGEISTGTFNVGGGTTATVRDVVALLEQITGLTAAVTYAPRQLGDVLHTSADTARARDALGFAPATDLATGLAREVDWMRGILQI
jgi:UDP-glucose 4-epimerase